MIQIDSIQALLKQENIHGWLLYDFRHSNSIACDVLEISPSTHLTRRLFYWIPQKGVPVALVSFVETHVVAHLPGETRVYTSLESMREGLKKILPGRLKVAMEYSFEHHIPTISKVDAGIVEMIKGLGHEVVSSGAFLQQLTCTWDDEQLISHREAGEVLNQVADKCWNWVSDQLKQEKVFSEYDIQQFILKEIEERGCEMDGPPICGVNHNSANPHYTPNQNTALRVQKGDWILIDLWCKKKGPRAVYADITRVAIADQRPSSKQQEVYHIVRESQRRATQFVEMKVHQKESLKGFEVDKICRDFITKSGYGDYFTHRTGHNIHTEDHGPGTNIDGFETLDDRLLIPRTCFSIEPGIYLPNEFGVRQEYDVFIHSNYTVEINGGIQDEIVTLL
ncbi:M24 family metallopeptidase [Rhabdochlamydiaceae symbiont of Dictyostelium giganteum]|uniref:M24 family metallopeptidase n=1 Tax=Rhabdochlamydiaceae symbiont of Dictyostelium giganteum TaxID=3342349 RepID=UPI00384C9C85